MNLKERELNAIFLKKFTLAIIKVVASKKYNYSLPFVIDTDLIPKLTKELEEKYVEEVEKPILQKKEIPYVPTSGTKDGMPSIQKLIYLINDPKVSIITISGAEKPALIIKTGQKMFTKISFTKEEMHQIIEDHFRKAHLPTIEGPFNIYLDDYEISGVYSTMLDSKFTIIKETPYAMIH